MSHDIEANVKRLVAWLDKNGSDGPLVVVHDHDYTGYLLRKCEQAIIARRLRRYLARIDDPTRPAY